ncbi:MAG: PIN domain-containing protein [Chloroflexi bacterium]|nr:PIN domain-containing protein [Chloroflexota bacterium]
MNYVIDASVFVSAAQASDVHYAESVLLFGRLEKTPNANVFCPTLLLAEYSASIVRRTGDASLAESLVDLLYTLQGLKLEPLTESRARRAARTAAMHRLRGADAVYVALAEETSATLVTWDIEMIQRGAAVVPLLTPSAWIETQKPKNDKIDTEASS